MADFKLDGSINKLTRVQPLHRAYNHLLQVLITRFRLQRLGQSGGVKLNIEFADSTPAIWNNQAKSDIKRQIRSFKSRSAKYQQELNKFLLDGIGETYQFNDPSFPFRYASGGTLPIVTIDRRKYYCLYYREIFPIGWNIVNGATDTIFELIDPQHAVKRELGEELFIVHPGEHIRYIFEWDNSELVDWPGFTAARRLFHKQHQGLALEACKKIRTKLNWSAGPDSLFVKYDINKPNVIRDCFVNINAIDFGIEIDKIAHISINRDSILFDGEINNRVSVGAPIGLFPVSEMNRIIQNEHDNVFLPSMFFYGARSFNPRANPLEKIIRERYLPRLRKGNVLSQKELDSWYKTNGAGRAFDLCPVTRSLVYRHVTHENTRRKKQKRKNIP